MRELINLMVIKSRVVFFKTENGEKSVRNNRNYFEDKASD